MQNLPIVSPRGHTQAAWFASNDPFPDPANCLYNPTITFTGCYTVRESRWRIWKSDVRKSSIPRKVWRILAGHYFLSRGTPTRMWLDYGLQELFRLEELRLEKSADFYFDTIPAKLGTPEFLPRALY